MNSITDSGESARTFVEKNLKDWFSWKSLISDFQMPIEKPSKSEHGYNGSKVIRTRKVDAIKEDIKAQSWL